MMSLKIIQTLLQIVIYLVITFGLMLLQHVKKKNSFGIENMVCDIEKSSFENKQLNISVNKIIKDSTKSFVHSNPDSNKVLDVSSKDTVNQTNDSLSKKEVVEKHRVIEKEEQSELSENMNLLEKGIEKLENNEIYHAKIMFKKIINDSLVDENIKNKAFYYYAICNTQDFYTFKTTGCEVIDSWKKVKKHCKNLTEIGYADSILMMFHN